MGLADGPAVGQTAHQRRVQVFVALLFGADKALFFKAKQEVEQGGIGPAALRRQMRRNLAPCCGAVAGPERGHNLFFTAGKLFHERLLFYNSVVRERGAGL